MAPSIGAAEAYVLPAPYGASMFEAKPASGTSAITDPERKIGYGDRVLLRFWGALEYEDVILVDAEGGIFIPKVGPVIVAGKTLSEAQAEISKSVSKVYQDNVSVHATMADINPVSVYVSGGVVSPGRFEGSQTDTVLDFLLRSGGIEPEAGSYRNVKISRNGEQIGKVDLYDFLLGGRLPEFDFQNGDVIFVDHKGFYVSVMSGAAIEATFEFSDGEVTGQDLINRSRADAGVSHVMVTRSVDRTDRDAYMPISDFRSYRLKAGDRISFSRDVISSTNTVRIEGEVEGQKTISIKKGATLKQVLSFIAVDPSLVDLSAIHIKRPSVALEQRRALDQSLATLQRKALRQTSSDPATAQVRAAEAEMISAFVEAAKTVKFEGKVVLSRQGEVSDVVLQEGDVIVIPRKTDTVVVNGEVTLSNAFLYADGLRVKDYVSMAGGLTSWANRSQFVVNHLNGSSTIADADTVIRNGDQIIAMPKTDRKGFILTQQIVGIIYQIAVGTGAIINP